MPEKSSLLAGYNVVFGIQELLKEVKVRDGSDLHLAANIPPAVRVRGELAVLDHLAPLTPDGVKQLLFQVLTKQQADILEKNLSLDLAVSIGGTGRFRLNAYYQRGCITCVFRRLADDIPLLETLGLPESVGGLAGLQNGLVLVTGPTGSGKSTTLAAIIDRINKQYRRNIITVEDPIEYLHLNNQSIINQRELYSDVEDFADALRSALRADPDVILVGEMRDLETMRTAIRAAETGHLVFSTLHSRDAVSSINRVVGAFPPEEQNQVRQQLSASLKAVISQQLLPVASGSGRVLAAEVMAVTSAVGNLIRLGKHEHIYHAIETGKREGMQTMDQSLEKLASSGRIEPLVALKHCRNPTCLTEKINSGRSRR
jgi:twitching motility protein PilT